MQNLEKFFVFFTDPWKKGTGKMCNKGTCFVLTPMSDEYTRLLNAIEMAIREVRLRPIGPQDNLGSAYHIVHII